MFSYNGFILLAQTKAKQEMEEKNHNMQMNSSLDEETNKGMAQTLQKSFVQVQGILDQNRLLINEINQNHESREPDNLSRNVTLIRELNSNISRVVGLYADMSLSFTKSVRGNSMSRSEGNNNNNNSNVSHKRGRESQL